MKGTDKIIAHIQADAEAKAQQILGEAKSRADEIKAQYDSKAKDAYDKAMNTNRKEGDALVESMSRMSEMENKKEMLALKQSMVASAFDKAKELVLNLPKEEYEAFLIRLCEEGIVSGDEEVILNAKDKAAYGASLVSKVNKSKNASLKLSEGVGEFEGGLILRRNNIEVNSTIELLIETNRSQLSADVVKVLFG